MHRNGRTSAPGAHVNLMDPAHELVSGRVMSTGSTSAVGAVQPVCAGTGFRNRAELGAFTSTPKGATKFRYSLRQTSTGSGKVDCAFRPKEGRFMMDVFISPTATATAREVRKTWAPNLLPVDARRHCCLFWRSIVTCTLTPSAQSFSFSLLQSVILSTITSNQATPWRWSGRTQQDQSTDSLTVHSWPGVSIGSMNSLS